MPRRERLRDAGLVILDETTPDAELRATVFALVHRDVFADAVERVSRLGPARGRYLHGAEEEPGQAALRSRSGSRGLEIEAAPAGRALLDAASGPGRHPTAFAPKGWTAQLKTACGRLDRPGYRLAVTGGLRRAIRRRDVFPARSLRYADPRKGLLGLCRVGGRPPRGVPHAEASRPRPTRRSAACRRASTWPGPRDGRARTGQSIPDDRLDTQRAGPLGRAARAGSRSRRA